ncbi:MAG: GNAT family N-acetyltransferase [Oscillospiraceae bacterium]|nr:GNAT family N-acetyltransferase [Oscillospiraceae bacterium]
MKVNNLYLAQPARRHRRAWHALQDELTQAGDAKNFGLRGCKRFGQYLRMTRNHARGKALPQGLVSATTYFIMQRGNPKILGTFNIRHELNDSLLNNPGGHIGYAIVPSERRKGYATEALRLGLQICKEMGITRVLVTCNKANTASANVIINNGGVLEDERPRPEDSSKLFQRYWIELT